jgi:GNAT superfamily N-acetyltransferase
MEIKIVEAQLHDFETIQELAYEIWPIYYANIISLDQISYMLGILYNVDALKDQMEKGQRFFLVNEDEKSVGFIGVTFYQEIGLKIDKLYLKEECRGKGYGRQLIDFVANEGKKIPTNSLFLNVNRFNESLLFYKKNGFEIVENLDIPFGPFWLNDFIMKKPI